MHLQAVVIHSIVDKWDYFLHLTPFYELYKSIIIPFRDIVNIFFLQNSFFGSIM